MKLKKMMLHDEHEVMNASKMKHIIFCLLLFLSAAINGQTSGAFNENSLIYSGFRKVSYQEANDWASNQELSWRSSSGKKALMKYGEKARNGIELLPPLAKDSVISFINGYISPHFNNEPIFLFTFNKKDSILSVDTTLIKQGRFFFEKEPAIESFSIVTTGNYPYGTCAKEFLLEKGVIKLTMNDSVQTALAYIIHTSSYLQILSCSNRSCISSLFDFID